MLLPLFHSLMTGGQPLSSAFVFCFAGQRVQLPAVGLVIPSSCGLFLDVLLTLSPKSAVFWKWTFSICQVHSNRWSSLQFLMALQTFFASILSLDHFGFGDIFSINFKQLLVASDYVYFHLFKGPEHDWQPEGFLILQNIQWLIVWKHIWN